MEKITLDLDEKGKGGFYISYDGKRIGEMIVSISGNILTVHHTEVLPEAEGKGFAKKLLAAMADHARENGLKVTPLCPYVHAQFKRNLEAYHDIWNK